MIPYYEKLHIYLLDILFIACLMGAGGASAVANANGTSGLASGLFWLYLGIASVCRFLQVSLK